MPGRSKKNSAPPNAFIVAHSGETRKTIVDVMQQAGYQTDEFTTGREFLMALKHDSLSGVVVATYRLADMTASDLLEGMQKLNAELPMALVVTRQDAPEAIAAGFTELLFTTTVSAQLPAMVHRVLTGEPEFTEREIVLAFSNLTQKESEIVERLVQGMSSQDICDEFNVSVKTIEAHRSRIAAKTRADDVGQLVRMWHAWRDLDE